MIRLTKILIVTVFQAQPGLIPGFLTPIKPLNRLIPARKLKQESCV